MMSPKPDYLRADSNLSIDLLNNCLMRTYYVISTTVGADFKGFQLLERETINLLCYLTSNSVRPIDLHP